MKYTRVCCKCGSKKVVKVVGNSILKHYIFINLFEKLRVCQLICTNCGYVEKWVNQSDLKKITKHTKNGMKKHF